MVSVLLQTKCVCCHKIIGSYQNKLSLVERYYDKNRAISTKTVGQYCWECYKREFTEVLV